MMISYLYPSSWPKRAVGCAVLMLWSVSIQASTEQLKRFMGQTQAIQADFSQDQNGKDRVSGQLSLQRPGRLRWVYGPPVRQHIIADGIFVWIYDVQLKQVTKQSIRQGLASSPASFLMGRNDIEKDFVLKDLPVQQSLSWVRAVPKNADQAIDKVELGLKNGDLRVLKMYDLSGAITTVRFSNIKHPNTLPKRLFHFVPPAGVDVLTQ